MKHTYIIIDENHESILNTHAVLSRFDNLKLIASATDYDEGLNAILEFNPQIVFLEIDPINKESRLSLHLINELHRYLKVVPKIIVITRNMDLAFEAIKFEVFDYFKKPIEFQQLRRTILKFEKSILDVPQFFTDPTVVVDPLVKISQEIIQASIANKIDSEKDTEDEPKDDVDTSAIANKMHYYSNSEVDVIEQSVPFKGTTIPEEKPLIICVKSYGDYRFIEAKEICYLQADNNSTDIHLYNGEMITAFKTLKHFEGLLNNPFVRIHNSYIVNIDYVSRIHTGNAVCYIKNTTTKLPFSKSYKDNVDAIIQSITKGNYLEI